MGTLLKKITTRYHLDSSDLNWIIENDQKIPFGIPRGDRFYRGKRVSLSIMGFKRGTRKNQRLKKNGEKLS
ncbi:MAG: hypothetical protein Ct9H300mP23_03880 [Nitrospinota bacterium]|nr:MAG: hypothetical protein Ct9H300mP23_03880 [Nitrospinota bacterium]